MISNSPQWISLIESEASLHDETNTKHKKDDQESNVLAFVNPPDAWFAPISTCFVLWHGGCSRGVQRSGVWCLSPRSLGSGLIMAVDHSFAAELTAKSKTPSIPRTQICNLQKQTSHEQQTICSLNADHISTFQTTT
jgi:hypothetical protein